jgi:hypothetical protein
MGTLLFILHAHSTNTLPETAFRCRKVRLRRCDESGDDVTRRVNRDVTMFQRWRQRGM